MFTKKIYKTILQPKIDEINRFLQNNIQNADIPESFTPMLLEATSHGLRFRPLLLLITNEGVGGNWKEAVAPACSVELLHKASLIHDDIIDDDSLRRGNPAFWKRYGKRQAISVGDLLIGLSLKTMSHWCTYQKNGRAQRIFQIFTETFFKTAIGELSDIYFESLPEVGNAEMEDMISFKSGSLVSASMGIGAISGGASNKTTENLLQLGKHIGIVFQMINDLNSISGKDRSSKGEYKSDAVMHKKTFATSFLQQKGISGQEFCKRTRDEQEEILGPLREDINRRIHEAAGFAGALPDGFMKNVFGSLLSGAHSDWFWTNNA